MLSLDGDELVDDVYTIFHQMLLESVSLQVSSGHSAFGAAARSGLWGGGGGGVGGGGGGVGGGGGGAEGRGKGFFGA